MTRDGLLELYAKKWLQRSRDGCGCVPICQCNSQPALEIYKEVTLDEASEMHDLYLALLKEEKQATPHTRDMPVTEIPEISRQDIQIMEQLCDDMEAHTGRPFTFPLDTRNKPAEPVDFATAPLDECLYGKNPEWVWQNIADEKPVEKRDSGFDEWQHEYQPLDVTPSDSPSVWLKDYSPQPLDPKGEAGSLKVPLWLVPPEASKQAALVHAHGAKKYGAFNWRSTRVCASTYISALLRHFDSWRDGEDNDPESGLSHLAHVAANVNILLDAAACGVLEDDRHKRPN